MKVLVIEDETSLLKSIIEYFRKEDFICEGVSTYDDGISRIDDFDYDCIILDINLPGGSGLDLLHYLRRGIEIFGNLFNRDTIVSRATDERKPGASAYWKILK